jgi:hypothetical protein
VLIFISSATKCTSSKSQDLDTQWAPLYWISQAKNSNCCFCAGTHPVHAHSCGHPTRTEQTEQAGAVVWVSAVPPSPQWRKCAVAQRCAAACEHALACPADTHTPPPLAVAEEVLFRGFLLTSLQQRFGRIDAFMVAAAMFAGIHLSVEQFFPLCVLGIACGAVATASESVLPAIALHATHNAAALVAGVLLRGS